MLFIAVPSSREMPFMHELGLSMGVLAKLTNVHKRLPAKEAVKILRKGSPPGASVELDPKTVALYAIGGAIFWEGVDHIIGFHPSREGDIGAVDLIEKVRSPFA